MKLIKCLTLIMGLALFGCAVFASVPSVTVVGTAYLTFPADTSQVCRNELSAMGCSDMGGCDVSNKTLKFNQCDGVSLTFQGHPGAPCDDTTGAGNSQAEVYLSSQGNTYDISLVNGYSGPVMIESDNGKPPIQTNGPWSSGPEAQLNGVYPYGCSVCSYRGSPNDCGFETYGKTDRCKSQQNTCEIDGDTKATWYRITFKPNIMKASH